MNPGTRPWSRSKATLSRSSRPSTARFPAPRSPTRPANLGPANYHSSLQGPSLHLEPMALGRGQRFLSGVWWAGARRGRQGAALSQDLAASRQVLRQPERDGEAFDLGYKGASLLQQANVTTAIAINSSWSVRDLPFAAGMAVNFGLTQQQALHAVTLAPAKIMGVDDRLGSLDEGKSATLIISSGDILDFATHKIESLYIDGREVDLNNRHQQLYNKYSQH